MHWKSRRRAQPVADIHTSPTKSRSIENSSGALVNHARHHQADAFTIGQKSVVFCHSANARRQILDERRDRKNRVIRLQGKLLPREIRKHEIGLAEANIDGDGETILSSNVKEGRLASAHRFAGRALVDHFLIDQFLHQDADGSARNIHSPRQIRPRNRLVLADKIKRNASINIARCAACGYAEILGIDFAHLARSFVRSWDNILSADFLSTDFLGMFLRSTRRVWRQAPGLGVQVEVRAMLWRPSISVVSEPRAVATGSRATQQKPHSHKLLCDPVATARGSDTYS